MRQTAFVVFLCAVLTSSALAQVRQSDREVDRLKGSVKSVITEVADYRLVEGESVEGGRVIISGVTYDADGNWLNRKEYDTVGNLSRSLLFKFIGKTRVAIDEDVVNENSLVSITPLPRGRRVDPRYTYSFRYRHDVKGNRVEEVVYHSDGSLYLRHVYRIRGNHNTVFVYLGKRQLDRKLEYTLNDRGNEIKVLLSESTTGDKITYQYIEFDSQENWTKRVETRGFKDFDEGSFSKIKPWNVQYRKLTYH